jgi:carboxyl-terminal processing protease
MKLRNIFRNKSFTTICIVLIALLFAGCNKKEDNTAVGSQDSIYIFIDEVMNSWYYWYKEVPQVDIFQYNEPSALLDALVYKPLDRWSFIDNAETINSLFEEGQTFGFGFMIRFDYSGNLHVIYVYKNSDAYSQGIRKGNIVRSINGTDVANFTNTDFDPFFDDSPATWTFEILDNNSQQHQITLTKTTITQNAVFLKKIFDNVAGKKVGYLAYEDFLGYGKPELDEAFTYFKDNQIDELIVDLRYNLGGYVSLAQQMAEMIIPSTIVGHEFVSFSHNDLVAPNEDTTFYFAHNALNLNLQRVFFLTTQFTASASELVINSLTPYMNVYLIGSQTHGKPVGMYGFLFHDWYLYPVSFKVLNAKGYGDYFNGLPVDMQTDEGLDKDWGDSLDPAIDQALFFIQNGTFNVKREFLPKSRYSDPVSEKLLSRKNLILLNR